MKDTKRRIMLPSFYNRAGISAYLEDMAAQGWMIECITSTGWLYRRTEPKHLHFTVSYYPKASEFDPEPTEGEKQFHDFCAHTGWQLACTSAQMQIFYNEQDDPIPIETEPELELQTIHASAKKGFLPLYIILLTISIFNGGLWISNLFRDPIDLLSAPTRLFTGFVFLLLALICAVELFSYAIWYARAKKAAQHGAFLEAVNTVPFQKALFVILLIGAAFWLINYIPILYENPMQRWLAILIALYLPGLFLITNGTKKLLKRKKVSKGINRAVTILTCFAASFLILGGITFAILQASSHGLLAGGNAETYQHGGMTWTLHQDTLPLVVEDLQSIECDDYVRERRGSASLLISRVEMHQYPRFDAENYTEIPQLSYTVTTVKIPFLYNLCKEHLIRAHQQFEPGRKEIFISENPSPWNANEVYRLYDSKFGSRNDYLLCYDNQFVEIRFDWEPTAEQMAVVSAKLSPEKPGRENS